MRKFIGITTIALVAGFALSSGAIAKTSPAKMQTMFAKGEKVYTQKIAGLSGGKKIELIITGKTKGQVKKAAAKAAQATFDTNITGNVGINSTSGTSSTVNIGTGASPLVEYLIQRTYGDNRGL